LISDEGGDGGPEECWSCDSYMKSWTMVVGVRERCGGRRDGGKEEERGRQIRGRGWGWTRGDNDGATMWRHWGG